MKKRSLLFTILASLALFGTVSPVFAQSASDPQYASQWYLSQIGAPQAWDITTGGDVVVAVLDTGVDLDHPDLLGNMWQNSKEIAGDGVDNDANGYIDDVFGWDFVRDDNDPSPATDFHEDQDAASHGTFIAGVIGAAANNATGFAGVAWHVRIMPLRVLDRVGSGSDVDVAEAVRYAVANGAQVINMSFAGTVEGSVLGDAIRAAHEAGVTVVAAMGNEAIDANTAPVYPACFYDDQADYVIGVAALDQNDTQAWFTNYGSHCVDIAAPGVDFYNLGYYDVAEGYTQQSLGPWDGTSFAAPLVSGVAALVKALYPSLTPEQIRLSLKLGVDPVISTAGLGAVGVGRVNALSTLLVAKTYAEQNAVSARKVLQNRFVALGATPGQGPRVDIYKNDGTSYGGFDAYATSFTGGVNVSLVDIIGKDDVPEVVVGAGSGGGPHVRIFTAYGALIKDFFAYDSASRKGVQVSAGDVDGDGDLEIVTAVGDGVSNDVVIWALDGKEQSRFSVEGLTPNTPFILALGNIDLDPALEIIVGEGQGSSRVMVYDGDGERLASLSAFEKYVNVGMSLAAGDVDADGIDEIVMSSDAGKESKIAVLKADGSVYATFSLGAKVGAVSVAVGDIDGDGHEDVFVSPTQHAGTIHVFDGVTKEVQRATFTVDAGKRIFTF
jgi:subtilisin family serine protease